MYYFIILRATKVILYHYERHISTLEKEDINPHIHMILESDLSEQTIRKQLQVLYFKKKQVSVKKVKDLKKSILYILKEGNILHNDLIEKQDLDNYLQEVQEIQKEIKEDKTNYLRYLTNKFKRDGYLEDLKKNKLVDNEFIEYEIVLFLLQEVKKDFKGFDKVIITRWKNSIFNYYFHNEFINHKIHKLLPNNTYAHNHNN